MGGQFRGYSTTQVLRAASFEKVIQKRQLVGLFSEKVRAASPFPLERSLPTPEPCHLPQVCHECSLKPGQEVGGQNRLRH